MPEHYFVVVYDIYQQNNKPFSITWTDSWIATHNLLFFFIKNRITEKLTFADI